MRALLNLVQVILTGRTKERISKIGEDSQWETNANVRLDPNSIASVSHQDKFRLVPPSNALQSYLYMVNRATGPILGL